MPLYPMRSKLLTEEAVEFFDVGAGTTYAQTLSNSIEALTLWEQGNLNESDFVKMSIKRLLDAQINMKRAFIDD